MAAAVEHQMLVDLVGDHQQVVRAPRARRSRASSVVGGDHAGRVVRRVEDQRPGPGRDRAAQRVDVDGEAAAVGTIGTARRWQPAIAMTGE